MENSSHAHLAQQLTAIAVRDSEGHIDAATALMVAAHLVFRFAGKLSLEERDIKLFTDMAELAKIIALEWEAAGAPIPTQRKS